MISARVRAFWCWALGLSDPLRWFFTATRAMSSTVAPARWAYWSASMAKWVNGAMASSARLGIPVLRSARATRAGLSTPMASTTSLAPDATSRQACRNAAEPEAETSSTCRLSSPVAPRWRSMARPGAMGSRALAT